jgi:hypothetical protein
MRGKKGNAHEKWWKIWINSVGVNQSCKARTFLKLKRNLISGFFPLTQSNPDISPTLRSANECLWKKIRIIVSTNCHKQWRCIGIGLYNQNQLLILCKTEHRDTCLKLTYSDCVWYKVTTDYLILVQGDSVARGPQLLSVKHYVIEIMAWIYIHIPGTMQNRTCS